jgi:HAD superfamily hydrolase (TIGR01484 family)
LVKGLLQKVKAMKYVFEHWSEVEALIRPYRRVYVLTDYDGTLTPIVDHPHQARLDRNIKNLLKSLVRNRKFILVIITGRVLKENIQLVGIQGAYYVGNHGLEMKGPSLTFVHPLAEKLSPLISKICEDLKAKLESISGILVEDKGMTTSIHYRMAPKKIIKEIKKVWQEELHRLARDLKVDDSIVLTGYLKSDEVKAAYTLADMVLVPSLVEGFNLTTIEGWLYKKPVLVSRGAGSSKLVSEGINGYTFEPNNPEELAEKIKLLLKNKEASMKMGENGFNTLRLCYTDVAVKRLAEIFDEVLKNF